MQTCVSVLITLVCGVLLLVFFLVYILNAENEVL
jgi:hypothetical protein